MNELEQTMTRYLLGELSESEQSALEEKYFTDPQIFNEVLKTESELVDGHARGQLAKDLRERFEKSFMVHPARRDRVKFAAALVSRLDQAEESIAREQPTVPLPWGQELLTSLLRRRPALKLSLAFAILLVMLGGGLIFIELRHEKQAEAAAARIAEQQRREREQSQQTADQRRQAEEAAAQQAAVGSNPQQLPQPTPSPEVPALHSVSLALMVGGVRSGDSTKTPILVIPPGTTQARLLLNLKENNYSNYRASLQTIGGAEIFNQNDVKPGRTKSGASFVFTVSANKLRTGDYVLTLRGINPDGEVDDLSKSLFRVEKK